MNLPRTALAASAATAALLLSAAAAQAVVVVDYTGSVAPDFTFNSFAGDGIVTPSADGVAITLPAFTTGDAALGNFGGLGTNASILATPSLDPAAMVSVTARLDGGTTAPTFVLAFREQGVGGAAGEVFSYNIPTASLTTDGFTTVSVPASTFFFNGDTTNGIPDQPIGEASVQSNFGGTGALNLTVSSVSVTPSAVPEPASLGLLALGGGLLLRRRR